MWDRAGTACMVVVAAVALSAAFNHHYSLPSKIRALASDTRRVRNRLSDLTAKELPFLEAETAAMRHIAELDNQTARAEASALLLQSQLLEILAALHAEEQSAVPKKIKGMLSRVDVLSKDDAVALVAELISAKARERKDNFIPGKMTMLGLPPGNETVNDVTGEQGSHGAAQAKAYVRRQAVQQLDELVSEVEQWRNSPAQQPAAADEKSKPAGEEHGLEARAMAALRKVLNAERKHLQEGLKKQEFAERERTMQKLRKVMDVPVPDTGLPPPTPLPSLTHLTCDDAGRHHQGRGGDGFQQQASSHGRHRRSAHGDEAFAVSRQGEE